jgi:hypothetical protein
MTATFVFDCLMSASFVYLSQVALPVRSRTRLNIGLCISSVDMLARKDSTSACRKDKFRVSYGGEGQYLQKPGSQRAMIRDIVVPSDVQRKI